MDDPPVEFVWHDGPVPAGLPVTQVYGWLLCPVTGRVLIQEQDDGTLPASGSSTGTAGGRHRPTRTCSSPSGRRLTPTTRRSAQEASASPSPPGSRFSTSGKTASSTRQPVPPIPFT